MYLCQDFEVIQVKSTQKQRFIIPFRTLPEGEHQFDFQIDKSFFDAEEVFAEYSGHLVAVVLFLKKDSKRKLNISISGNLTTNCDRCLEEMELAFETSGGYYLREGEEDEEEKEDVVFVAPEDTDVDMKQLFYEMIVVGLPQKKMHDEADCNVEMLERMGRFTEEKHIDPRWAELEKLIKKDK